MSEAMVVQLLETCYPGDAISNYALGIDRRLANWGIPSRMYAFRIAPELKGRVLPAYRIDSSEGYKPVVLYHFAVGSPWTHWILQRERGWSRVALVYHNLTPARYFLLDNPILAQALRRGREELVLLRNSVDLVIADSDFNAEELTAMGYQADMYTIPPVFLDDQEPEEADPGVVDRFSDGWLNLLSVGRIAPNKRQEDLIKILYRLKHVIAQSRLLLVGVFEDSGHYFRWLDDLVEYLNVSDVVFAGRVSQAELNAYYKVATVYVSMSEHEGFGIPLVESMQHDVPIVAYSATAVPYTLGDAGILVKERDFPVVAEVVSLLASDGAFREGVLEAQRARLAEYRTEVVEQRLYAALSTLLAG